MNSMSNSSLVDVEPVEPVFGCFVDARTDGRRSIRKVPGGISRVACPAVYDK